METLFGVFMLILLPAVAFKIQVYYSKLKKEQKLEIEKNLFVDETIEEITKDVDALSRNDLVAGVRRPTNS